MNDLPAGEALDGVVIGAGQAGLATSYFCKRRGIAHVVLERGRVGESWRMQRWDSFVLNTPNWLNGLPGDPYEGPARDEFYTRDELVSSFERYRRRFDLPVRLGVEVVSVEKADRATEFSVQVRTANGDSQVLTTRSVVVASGIMEKPRTPELAAKLPDSVASLHAGSYRNALELPEGVVVVVGSAQSGCQIAADLVDAGRKVYLCTSRVGRIPRRYRGRDIGKWFWDSGVYDVARSELEDPAELVAAQPQVSGVGRYGHTVSLQQLAHKGVVLLGRVVGVEGPWLILDDKLCEHIRFADDKSADVKRNIDAYIEAQDIAAAPVENDPADQPWTDFEATDTPRRIDLSEARVGAVIWCTGFKGDFSWIRLPVLDEQGTPIHERGVSPVPGLYFVGFPWLHKRKSGLICGVEEDAAHIAAQVGTRASAANK